MTGHDRAEPVGHGPASLEAFLATLPDSAPDAGADHADDADDADRTLISFLLRASAPTEGLDETLLSLTSQSDTDFEVLLLAEDEPRALERAWATLREHPPTLRERAVVVPASGSPTQVLNTGLEASGGAYVVFADDLTWFAHWVESVRHAAEQRPRSCVRGVVLEQDVTTVHVGGVPGTRATGAPAVTGATTFSLAQHVSRPLAPTVGIAVPRSLVTGFGVVLDPSYGTAAVRRHLLRAVELAGVVDVGEVVALHRRSGGAVDESDEDLARLVVGIDEHPWLAPAGAATAALASAGYDAEALVRVEEELAHHRELVAMKEVHIANLEEMLRARGEQLERTQEKLAKRAHQVERLRAKLAQADHAAPGSETDHGPTGDIGQEPPARRGWRTGRS